MSVNKVPCICGHLYEQHGRQGVDDIVCLVASDRGYKDRCCQYVPDNLKYLENLCETDR